jgi:hypothetical protein
MIVPIGIAFALAVLIVILVLLLRRKLSEKYAALWLVIGLATLLLALFPGLLVWLAEIMGVQVASNLLFAMSLALLIGVTLHLSWELSMSEEEVRRVAEEVAILRAEVDALQSAHDKPSSAQRAPEAARSDDLTQGDASDEPSA